MARTPIVTSVPIANRCTSTRRSYRPASTRPLATSSASFAMVSPMVDPSRTGLTTNGSPNRATTRSTTSAATPCLISSSSNSGTWRPIPPITLPARDLSMHSAEASTPEPVYGSPRSSSIPCTVPSSPNRPWSALNTQSKPPSRRTSHVPPSRSTAVTSWPRPRKALATCSPDRSDTSRSADLPPRSTASFTSSDRPSRPRARARCPIASSPPR